MAIRDDIKEIKRQNLEMVVVKRLEIINLYLKYLVILPKRKDVRKHLVAMMKGFFIHYKNELVILNRLKSAYISQEDYDEIIVELDDLSDENFDFYDAILRDFEITLALKDFDRVMFRRPHVEFLSDEKRDEVLSRIDALEIKGKSL